jgi:hypothetical protein
MRRKGVKSFNLAQVGRHAESLGVLKTQTLRNAGGEDYRSLIDAFARDNGVGTTTLSPTKHTPLEEAIEAIADLDVRTRLRMILVENARQREEINRLRQAFKHLQSNLGEPRPTPNAGAVLPPLKPNIDLEPIKKFLSECWIEERRWTIEPNGSIYDEHGECLTPVGLYTALLAVIRLNENL